MITQREFTVEWIAALRSGEYRQARGKLCLPEPDTYCCLGLACQLLSPHGLTIRTGNRFHDHGPLNRYGSGGWETAVLPMGVQTWLGFDTPRGDLPHGRDLAGLNDGDDGHISQTFDEIADAIEYLYLPRVCEGCGHPLRNHVARDCTTCTWCSSDMYREAR